MANPEIEIAWGGGQWRPVDRRACRPAVAVALSLASDGLDYFGIECQAPKRAEVCRVGRRYPDSGASSDAKNFELYIQHNPVIKRRKVERFTPFIASTSFHEIVHCVRYEAVPEDTLLEICASEGIAHVAESQFDKILLSPSELSPQRTPEWDTGLQAELLEAMALDEGEPDSYEAWFDNSGSLVYPPAGVSLGVLAVQRKVDAGYEIADIITMPTEEILDLVA